MSNPGLEALQKHVEALELKSSTENEQHALVVSELASLKDQMIYLTAAKDAVEGQLREERRRREAAEETVELLRGKVEEARRGVMTLQKQEKDRRRVSAIPSGAEGLGLAALGDSQASPRLDFGEPRAVKRQSTIGLGGAAARGHRRISSQSEPGFDVFTNLVNTSPPKRAGGLRELKLAAGPSSPPVQAIPTFTRSLSAQNVSPEDRTLSPLANTKDTPLPLTPSDDFRSSIAVLERRLAESEEARIASELCLKALREFIASGANETGAVDLTHDEQNQDSLKGIRLPPLPTDRDAEASFDGGKEAKKIKSGWGLRLWKDKEPGSPAPSTAVEPPQSGDPVMLDTDKSLPLPPAASASSTPLSSFVASWTKGVAPGSPTAPPPNQAAAARSFSFFGKKAQPAEDEGRDAIVATEPAEPVEDSTQEGTDATAGFADVEGAAKPSGEDVKPSGEAVQPTSGEHDGLESVEEATATSALAHEEAEGAVTS